MSMSMSSSGRASISVPVRPATRAVATLESPPSPGTTILRRLPSRLLPRLSVPAACLAGKKKGAQDAKFSNPPPPGEEGSHGCRRYDRRYISGTGARNRRMLAIGVLATLVPGIAGFAIPPSAGRATALASSVLQIRTAIRPPGTLQAEGSNSGGGGGGDSSGGVAVGPRRKSWFPTKAQETVDYRNLEAW